MTKLIPDLRLLSSYLLDTTLAVLNPVLTRSFRRSRLRLLIEHYPLGRGLFNPWFAAQRLRSSRTTFSPHSAQMNDSTEAKPGNVFTAPQCGQTLGIAASAAFKNAAAKFYSRLQDARAYTLVCRTSSPTAWRSHLRASFKGKIASGGVFVFLDREIPFALGPIGCQAQAEDQHTLFGLVPVGNASGVTGNGRHRSPARLKPRRRIAPHSVGDWVANKSCGNPAVFADVNSRFDADAGFAVFSREDKQVDAFSQ